MRTLEQMAADWVGRIVIIGNIKGGSSKSTTASHLIVKLLKSGLSVGVIDLDVQQRSTDAFFANRAAYSTSRGLGLAMPLRREVKASREVQGQLRMAADHRAFREAVDDLIKKVDVVVVDCPGADTTLSQIAHVAGDLLITPIGASKVDLDLISRFDAAARAYTGPSVYTEAVVKANAIRRNQGDGKLAWSVVFNRYDPRQRLAENKVWALLDQFSRDYGFELSPGLAMRSVYTELWEYGMTVQEVANPADGRALDFDAARGEVNRLFAALSDRLASLDNMEASA